MQNFDEGSIVIIDVPDNQWKELFPNSTFWLDSDTEEWEEQIVLQPFDPKLETEIFNTEIFWDLEDISDSEIAADWEETIQSCFSEVSEKDKVVCEIQVQEVCKVEVKEELEGEQTKRERIRAFNKRCESRQRQREENRRRHQQPRRNQYPAKGKSLWNPHHKF